jgi:pimeloyl-ACP methyl ester carboxylesterase
MTTTAGQSYATAPNRLMHASNGIDYAYREIGTGTIPLVLLQHFRGNLENWDPPLLDALASERRVTAFDNVGIGATTGTTPNTMEQMAHDALFFIDALEVPQVDILGFSIGSFVAQEIALTRPDVVRRLVLASSAPRGGAGMHGWAPEVINAVGRPEPDPGGYLDVFFTSSPASRQAGQEALGRIYGRTVDVDEFASWSSRLAQYDAVCDWGIPNHAALQRVSAISHPVFIANGDSDPMILPHFSYLLAGLIPKPKSKSTPTLPTGSCSSTPPSSPPTSTHSSTTASQIKPKLLQIRAMTCEPTLLPAGQDNPSRRSGQGDVDGMGAS